MCYSGIFVAKKIISSYTVGKVEGMLWLKIVISSCVKLSRLRKALVMGQWLLSKLSDIPEVSQDIIEEFRIHIEKHRPSIN